MVKRRSILALLKQEEDELVNFLRISRSQAEAIKNRDQERMMVLLEEREKMAARIESLYKKRIEAEEILLADNKEDLGIEGLEEKKEELAKIAREIIKIDQANEQEIKKNMEEIEENLAALRKIRFLKEGYLKGIREEGKEPIFINKYQ